MGYPRKRYRKRRGGGFLVIAVTILIVVIMSHPAIHYSAVSMAHMLIFTGTMITAACMAGMSWAITQNSIMNRRRAASGMWVNRSPASSAPAKITEWTPHPDQVVEAEVVDPGQEVEPHWQRYPR